MLHLSQLLLPIAFVLVASAWWFMSTQPRAEQMLLLALGIFAAQWIGGIALIELTRLNLPTFDGYIYKIDNLFGQPSFFLGRAIWRHPLLLELLNAAYQAIMPAVAIILGLHIWRRLDETRWAIYAFLLNFAVAPVLYTILPVCGPRYAFSSYPLAPLAFSAHLLHLHAPPNGLPSVHLSTALLILWFSRSLPVGRWLAAIYLLCMVVATLGSGEHYLFDLLCAIVYAACIIAVAWRLVKRRRHELHVRGVGVIRGQQDADC